MNIELIAKVTKIYHERREQIVDLHAKVSLRGEVQKISLGARSLDEVDIMFVGYVNRYRLLLSRLNDLDTDFYNIFIGLQSTSFWYKLFGWLPFIKINKSTTELLKDFVEKWEKYEPGW